MKKETGPILWGRICLILIMALLPFLATCARPTPAPTPSVQPTPPKLPEIVTMTALPATIGMGARAVPLVEAAGKFSPMKVRIEPRDTDPAIIAPLHFGDAEFAHVTGVTMYRALTGDFKDLGIVPAQRVWNGYPFIFGMATRGNSGIRSVADLRGKRIPQSPASVSWSKNQEAILAFAGLTLADVRVETVPSIAAGYQRLLEGTVDAAGGAPFGSAFVELSASRHGIFWFDLPAADVQGWQRLQTVVPAGRPVVMRDIPGLEKGRTVTGFGYEEAIWSMPKVPDGVVYAFARALKEGYDTYSAMEKSLKDWTWERAYSLEGLLTIAPYHSGAVKFFKDMGVWTPEHEKFQQEALRLERERLRK